jgi:uncharacterized protein (DUF433 family)
MKNSIRGGPMNPERRELAPGIEANPEVVSGAPVLQGTRMQSFAPSPKGPASFGPVMRRTCWRKSAWAVLRAVADLGSIEEAARAYEVPSDRIRQALYYAADLLEEIRVGILA